MSTFAVAIFEPLEFPLKSWSPLAKTASTFTITVSLSNQSAHVLPGYSCNSIGLDRMCVGSFSFNAFPASYSLCRADLTMYDHHQHPLRSQIKRPPIKASSAVHSIHRLTVSLGKPLKWSPCTLEWTNRGR